MGKQKQVDLDLEGRKHLARLEHKLVRAAEVWHNTRRNHGSASVAAIESEEILSRAVEKLNREKARLYRAAAEEQPAEQGLGELSPADVEGDLPKPKFKDGDRVRAIAGPYKGRRGIVLRSHCSFEPSGKPPSILVRIEFREVGIYAEHWLAHDELVTEVERGS